MAGQMCWLSLAEPKGEKVLHLRLQPNQPWSPYTAWVQFAVPDYNAPGGSQGWATYQKLLRADWTLVSSASATKSLSLSSPRIVASSQLR